MFAQRCTSRSDSNPSCPWARWCWRAASTHFIGSAPARFLKRTVWLDGRWRLPNPADHQVGTSRADTRSNKTGPSRCWRVMRAVCTRSGSHSVSRIRPPLPDEDGRVVSQRPSLVSSPCRVAAWETKGPRRSSTAGRARWRHGEATRARGHAREDRCIREPPRAQHSTTARQWPWAVGQGRWGTPHAVAAGQRSYREPSLVRYAALLFSWRAIQIILNVSNNIIRSS